VIASFFALKIKNSKHSKFKKTQILKIQNFKISNENFKQTKLDFSETKFCFVFLVSKGADFVKLLI